MKPRKTSIITISTLSVILILASIGTYFLVKEYRSTPMDFLGFNNLLKTVPNGSVYNTTEGLVIMELNGSYSQMGYAHGQLIGQFIKYSIEYVITGVLSGNIVDYQEICNAIDTYVNKSKDMHSEEIAAIYSGAMESDYDLYIPALGRNWTENDLWVLNTIQDWNQFFCSGFGAYGTSTAATLNSRTIIGRDLDFTIDPRAYITQMYIIIIYHGNASRNTLVSFAWPGIITCATAYNERGVWLSTNNANGVKTEEEGRTPMGISMRNFLEQEDGINTTNDAIDFFLVKKPFVPFLFLLGSNETVTDPVVVLEGNDNEVVARTGTNEGTNYIFLTNHQRILMPPQTDCHRYNSYNLNFQTFTTTDDQSISIDEAIFMLKDGGAGKGTINCVLFFPDTLEFRIGYTRVIDPLNVRALRGGPDDPLMQITFKVI
ncbi:MAG: hypothetical protein JXA54_05125 [Candidatus Heimdallarchaeota archaeon]|nr:hypothetical protein [Candidatus Heimdallarchaeota archaeon]